MATSSFAPMPQTVAMVGLGTLGMAIGRHLLHTGVKTVLGVDRDPSRRTGWEALTGRTAVASAAELPGGIEAAFVTVAEPSAVQAVLDELRRAVRHDVSMPAFVLTTLAPDAAEAVMASAAPPVHPWPIPVSGGELAALRGRLLAIVPEQLPAQLVAVLRGTIARIIVVAPGVREAAAAKLLANAHIAYQFAALDEVMAAGETLGVDASLIRDVVRDGSAGTGALDALLHYAAGSLTKDLSLLPVGLRPVAADQGPAALHRARKRLGSTPRGS